MSYLNEYTYGRKTRAQIDALTGMTQYCTVFNTDHGVMEIFQGNVWCNHDTIVISGGVNGLEEGDIVQVDSSAKAILAVSNTQILGVVVRGGDIDDDILIAIKGTWQVKYIATTTASGNYAELSATSGIADNSATSSINTIGVCMENITTLTGELVNVALQINEVY